MNKILILMFCIIFLLIQFTPLLSAESCINYISVHVKSYETYENDGDFLSYRESSYQITSSNSFFREGDYLFIEKINANIDFYCEKDDEIIYLKFKRPDNEEFGEQIGIELKYGNSSNYELKLSEKNKPGNYIDSLGNRFGFTGSKRLDKIGKWEFELFYSNHSKIPSGKSSFINKVIEKNNIWIQLARDQIIVVDRVAVMELETLRQLKEDSKKSSRNSLFVVAIIGIATILFMYFFHRKEEKRIIKTEEGKQFDLLKTLLVELNFLEENLKAYNKTFSCKDHYPLHGLWNIDTSLYFKSLSHKIQNHETIGIKENLIVIKHKLLLINNINAVTKKLNEENIIEFNRKKMIEIIEKEILPVLERSKKLIEQILK